jgi:hypothetical protein
MRNVLLPGTVDMEERRCDNRSLRNGIGRADAVIEGERGQGLAGDEEAQLPVGGIRFPDYLRPTYANFVNVNHTPWDFRMTFGVLKSPMPGAEVDQAQEAGAIEPEAVADIILPANLMHGVISALKDNFERYIAQYGAPGLNPEGPEQRG